MLHNPKWDVANSSIMTVGSLVNWLERKPIDGQYMYSECKGCLLYQYFNDMGMEVHHVDSSRYYLGSDTMGVLFPYILNQIAYGNSGENEYYANEYYTGRYRTFGEALRIARDLIAQGW